MLPLASKILLFPYWLILSVRNFLYDKAILKSEKFDVPIVSIGNISVGGTGKTPHIELLLSSFQDRYKVAVVSLGYKRKTKGLYIVRENDDYTRCGDEPLQIKRKFPSVIVAVCKKREVAIRTLIEKYNVDLILLDDGYQYRKVTPQCNVLLVNYKRSITKDNLLPIGRLRDLPSQKNRADIVVISKSPNFAREDGNDYDYLAAERVKVEDKRWRKELRLKESQKLYFSTICYDELKPVFEQVENHRYVYSKFAICFSGIANDFEFKAQLVGYYTIEKNMKFADHKNYSKRDILKITKIARRLPEAVIITTEKDSVRLVTNKYIPDDIKARMFYLPLYSKIIPAVAEEDFIKSVLSSE